MKRESKHPRFGMLNVWVLLSSTCYWAWFDESIFRPTFFVPFKGSEVFYSLYFIVTMVSGAVILLVAALNSKRVTSFLALKPYGLTNMAVALTGTLVVMLGASLMNLVVVLVGSVLTGAACSFFLLQWARIYSREGAKSAGILISAAIASAVLIDVFIIGLAPLFAAFFTVVLPLLSTILLVGFHNMVDDSAPAERVLSLQMIFPASRHRFFGLSLSLVASFFIFGLSFGFMQFNSAFYPTELYPFSSDTLLISRGITAFIIFTAMYFFPQRTYTVFRIGILVGIAGFIAVPFLSTLGNSSLVSGFVIAVGYTTFDIITWTILSELTFVTGSDAASTFGSGRFVVHASIIVGFLTAFLLLSNPQTYALQETFSTTVGYFLIVAEMLLLGENSALWTLIRTNSLPGQIEAPALEPDEHAGSYTVSSLAQIIETYGLTERESEIFRCLLTGRSRPRIAQMLFISENTVNSHIRHIYNKLGVHGLQDLLDHFS